MIMKNNKKKLKNTRNIKNNCFQKWKKNFKVRVKWMRNLVKYLKTMKNSNKQNGKKLD